MDNDFVPGHVCRVDLVGRTRRDTMIAGMDLNLLRVNYLALDERTVTRGL